MSELDPKVEAYKALEEARAKIDTAEKEGRALNVDEQKFVDDAMSAVDDHEAAAKVAERDAKKARIEAVFAASKEAAEEARKEAATPKGVQLPEDIREGKSVEIRGAASPEYAKAFEAYARGDDSVKGYLIAEAKADGAIGADSTGGYLVPTPIWNELWVDESAGFPLLDAVTTYNFTGTTLKVDQAFSHGTFGLVSEAGTPSAADEAYTQVSITAYKLQRLSKISDESLTDPQFDVASHLSRILARAAAEKENAYLTTGAGSTEPQGIVTGVYATSGQRVTGATGQATTIGADDVFTVLHRVARQYRGKATWMCADDSIRILRTLKDSTGNYLWNQGLNGPESSTLAGRPVLENTDVADMAASAKSLLLADLKGEVRAIPQGGEMAIMRLNELYAGTGQVGFRATRRFGAGFAGVTTSGAIWVNGAS
jgi:HK97 family phage major capsid protein